VKTIAAGLMSAKIVKNATLKVYPGFPHVMPTTNADQINADLLNKMSAQGRSRKSLVN
jgi:hypothetical protein